MYARRRLFSANQRAGRGAELRLYQSPVSHPGGLVPPQFTRIALSVIVIHSAQEGDGFICPRFVAILSGYIIFFAVMESTQEY